MYTDLFGRCAHVCACVRARPCVCAGGRARVCAGMCVLYACRAPSRARACARVRVRVRLRVRVRVRACMHKRACAQVAVAVVVVGGWVGLPERHTGTHASAPLRYHRNLQRFSGPRGASCFLVLSAFFKQALDCLALGQSERPLASYFFFPW